MAPTHDSDIKKALVSVTIEETLMEFGLPVYEIVVDRLYNEYKCYIPDCYENPEYLQRILQDLYGDAGSKIKIQIEKKLEEFSQQNEIKQFLEAIK